MRGKNPVHSGLGHGHLTNLCDIELCMCSSSFFDYIKQSELFSAFKLPKWVIFLLK